MEMMKKEVEIVGIAYFSLVGSFCFILEFVFDFTKDNLVILVMRYLFSYQRLIILDFWKDNLMILEINFLLIKDKFFLVKG